MNGYGLKEPEPRMIGPHPGYNPFEEEEDRRFVPVPEAVRVDLPRALGPHPGYDPFEEEEREPTPEIKGLRPPATEPEEKYPWLEKPIEPFLGTTAEQALMIPAQVLAGTQELAAGLGAGIQWLGNRLDNKIIKEAGKKLGDYYRKEAERIGQPKSIAGKNVFDNPELLADPSYWIANTSRMTPSLAAAMIPAIGAAKTIQVAGQALKLTPALVARLAALGAAATGGAVGGAMEGAQTYQNMLDEGADETEAAWAGELMTLFAGTLNAAGIRGILSKVGGRVKQKLGAAAWEGLTEAGEEPAEVVSKLLAKYLTGQEMPKDVGNMFFESFKNALTVMGPAALTGAGATFAAPGKPAPSEEILDIEAVEEKKPTPTEQPVDLLDLVTSEDETMVKNAIAQAKKGIISGRQLEVIHSDLAEKYPASTKLIQDIEKVITQLSQVETPGIREGLVPVGVTGELARKSAEESARVMEEALTQEEELRRSEEGAALLRDELAEDERLLPGEALEIEGEPEEAVRIPIKGMEYVEAPELAITGIEPVPTEEKVEEAPKVEPTIEEIDQAAKEAETEPTEAQIEAGTYKKGHIKLYGFDISIENPKGSVRSGVDRQGKKWSQKLKHHYGYIRGTKGKDKDHLDVFIGPNPESDKVFVIDQTVPETGKFDEHKIMMGFPTIQQARVGYLANYERGWKGLGAITELTVDEFKEWTKGDTTKAIGEIGKIPPPEGPKLEIKEIRVGDFTLKKEMYREARGEEGPFHEIWRIYDNEGNRATNKYFSSEQGAISHAKKLTEQLRKAPPEAKIKPPVEEKVEEVAKPIPEAKEAYKMGKEEFFKAEHARAWKPGMVASKEWREGIENRHEKAVQQAIDKGLIESHPDYPELGKVEAKKSWQMTFDEFLKEHPVGKKPEMAEVDKQANHKIKIRQALKEKKAVPRHVLEEYKDEDWAKEALGIKEKRTPPEPKVEKIPEIEVKAREAETKARAKRLKFAASQKHLVPWIAASGGVWDPGLKGEINDIIYTEDARGRKKPRKGLMRGFLSRKTGRTLDVVVRDAREAGFDVKNTDHLLELIEKDLAAALINDIKGRVGKLTTEPTTEDEFIEGLIENGREDLRRKGYSEQEIDTKLEESWEDAEATPVDTREEEYTRLEREAIEEEERLTPEELVQETLIKKEAPFELKPTEAPPEVVGPLGKKAVIPTEKIPTVTKGEQVSLLPKEKGEQVSLEEAIEKVQKGKMTVGEMESLVKDTLKDERGSISFERMNKDHPAVFDNLVTVGKDVISEGHTKYSDFARQMKTRFSEIWEQIKQVMMRVWRAATAKLKEETGAIEYRKVSDEEKAWADKWIKEQVKPPEKQVAQVPKQKEEFKKLPKEEDKPPEPSSFEEAKEDWFGNKDWSRQVHTVEAKRIQDTIMEVLGKKRFDKEAQDIDQAIHVYLDLKRNPDHLEEFYDELTNDQKKIVNLATKIEENPGLMHIADYLRTVYDKIGQQALSQNVIFNTIDNYVARAWKIPKKMSTDMMQKFKTTSRHSKHRVFETILEGQAKGFELEVTGASNNLELLRNEIARTVEDKRLISKLRKIEWRDTGNPVITDKSTIEGYAKIEHPNFTYRLPTTRIKHGETKKWGPNARIQTNWGAIKEGKERATKVFDVEGAARGWVQSQENPAQFRIEKREYIWEAMPLYAPEEIAKRLNKILGVSKLKGLGPIDTITKYNAIFKSTILLTSLFHHQAFIRSYLLGTRHKTLAEWNPFKMYKEGLKAVNELGPEIELLVRNGLTLGKMQDWEENILRQEDTIIGRVLDKTQYTKAFKDWANEMRERQAKFLFQNFGAGLKAQAALIEYRNMLKDEPHLEPNERAKFVADLINDDFGGLHLQRMERDPTTQHIFRLLALAPDWCCLSDTRAMTKTGWKYHYELQVGVDEILAFNPDTKKFKWSMLKDKYVNESYKGKMVHIKNHNRAIVMTPEHTCYVHNFTTNRDDIVKAKSLQTNHLIPRCAGFDTPTVETYDDFFVKLVGWMVTDGHFKTDKQLRADGTTKEYYRGIITQSKPHTVEILKQMGLRYHTGEKRNHDNFITNHIPHRFNIPKEELLKLQEADLTDGLNWEFLSKLTKRQLQLLYDSMFLGDGTGQNRFCGKEKEVFYMTLIQTMLGLPSTFYQQEDNCWRTRHIKSKYIYTWGHHNNTSKIDYAGSIWCPSVDTGFWLAERQGLMFITGNTESNVNTMWKAFNSGEVAKTHLYRRFWASVATKGLTAMVIANILLSFMDEDNFIERFKKAWAAGHFRWLDIDVTPIYRLLGGKSEARKYFGIFGHFRDPMKFIIHPIRSAKHKGSVFFRIFLETLTGVDWKGHRFTSLGELLGYDDKGLYVTETKEHKIGEPKGGKLRLKTVTPRIGKKGPIGWQQIPSFMISQLRNITPVQVQNFLGWIQGEIEGFDAIGRSIGAHVGSTYPTEKKQTEEFVNQWLDIRREGGSFAELRAKVDDYNERQNLRPPEDAIPISWSTIAKKGINIRKAESAAERRKAVNE